MREIQNNAIGLTKSRIKTRILVCRKGTFGYRREIHSALTAEYFQCVSYLSPAQSPGVEAITKSLRLSRQGLGVEALRIEEEGDDNCVVGN